MKKPTNRSLITLPISTDLIPELVNQIAFVKVQRFTQAKMALDSILPKTLVQQIHVFKSRMEQILFVKHLWDTNVDLIITSIALSNITQSNNIVKAEEI